MPLVQTEVEVKTTSSPADDGILGWDWIEDFINYNSSEESDEEPIPKQVSTSSKGKHRNRKTKKTSKVPTKQSRGKAGQHKSEGFFFIKKTLPL